MEKRRRRRRRKSWFGRLSIGKKIGVYMAGVIVCLAASTVVYVAAKLGKVETKDIPAEDIVVNDLAEAVGEGYTNFALFGIDSREGELEKGTRTDCIIVASLNNATKEVKMVSVYRDTLLDLSDGTLQKCNAAYSYGGPEQAINMLNMNLDLDIQDYATVDFAAIADAIDLLGGIDLEIQQEEIKPLNKYVSETAMVAGKEAHQVTEAGMQHLDGVQATTYARIRSTAGGDFKRTERQRIIIEKIVEKAQQSNLPTINKIIDTVFPKISTSLGMTEILSYAKSFAKFKLVDSSGFPFDKTTDTISGLGSIVIPVSLESNVQKLHEFLYGTTDYTPSSKISSINSAVVSKVGQREAASDSALNSKVYTISPDDERKEQQQFSGQKNKNSSTGNNNFTGNTPSGGSSSDRNASSGGSPSGGTSSESAGSIESGSSSGGSTTEGGSSSGGSTTEGEGTSGSGGATENN